MNNSSLIKSLEKAVQQGIPTVIEGIGEELDPALDALLLRQTRKIDGQEYLFLSEKSKTLYNENFRLFLITNLPNPHFLPEVAAKVQIINFMITPNGLEEQLLAIVVRNEEKKLENDKTNLVLQNAENQSQLKY
jgi:dynein heavy chain